MSCTPRLLGSIAALCGLLGCVSSEEPASLRVPPPAMTPEQQQQMMQDYLAAQAPGEHQAHLEPLIGHFEAHVKQWMDPAAPPTESTGMVENSWVLGGRFVLTVYRGEDSGVPFEGMGLLGYDTLKQKHVSNWADSMGTFLWPTATGECSDDGNVIALTRVMTDPMTGGLIKIRDVTTIVDHDHITYEMFATHPGADEFKMLEAHYIRT
jgi:hypothetical protein